MPTGSKPSSCLRRARPDDAAEIARLTNELGYPATTTEIAARLKALLSRADHLIAVAAESEIHLLGWIAAEHRLLLHYAPRTEVVGLVVSGEARRRGIGQALLAAAEEWGAGLGARSILVRSNVARAESHPFYERLGYRREKTQHAYAKELKRSLLSA